MLKFLLITAPIAFVLGMVAGFIVTDKITVLDFSEMVCPICDTPLEFIVDTGGD